MNKQEIAEKRLNEFAARIQPQLECFVKEEKLLLPGQRVVFSIKVEEVPVVVQGTVDANPFLDMRMLDFFTAKRFREIGFSDAIASRAARVISYYGVYPQSRIESATVRDFIEANRKRLESKSGRLFINAGVKSKRAVLLSLADAGLWDKDSINRE